MSVVHGLRIKGSKDNIAVYIDSHFGICFGLDIAKLVFYFRTFLTILEGENNNSELMNLEL